MAGITVDNHDEVMGEINMVPFIDVMLVLLIVFIVTVPVMKQAAQVELPRAASAPVPHKPQTLLLTVQADGRYRLGSEALADADLPTRLQAAARQQPQPELHLHGDRQVRYERVAQALAAAQQAGLTKIGFVTQAQDKVP